MADQNPIRYQDLITPDDSLEKLIGQLEQLQKAYTDMGETIKSQAKEIADALKKVSGATAEGQKKIKESNDETKKLEQAYKRLDHAMSENGKQIQILNRARRDYTNYQKLMQQRGQEEIRTMQQIKNASYQQLSAQYSLNKAYINSLSLKDRELKKNKELINSTRQMYEQMKKLQADTGKMQLNVGNYPAIEGLLSGVGLRMGGVAAAGMALGKVIKDNVSLAQDYEKSLSVLAAILNTTKDGVEDLSQQAQHLGATTVFTAKEVVELQTELAKLGYTTQEIMNMAPSVLNFAQATGSSLADAASLAGAALRMFEKDTTHTTEFVDKMSAATTQSALNFSYLQNAMSTVSPVANAFGFKIEDVLALLGQLANAGFDASSAATATRNIILNLADANGKLAQSLGQPVTNLDDLIAGLKTLNDRGIDLGESLELTDKRSVAAFNTFLVGTDKVLALRDSLASCDGYAQKMADTMADNMEGSLKSLSSAWEGLNLHINQSNGLLRDMIDWLTKAVRWIDKVIGKLDDLWKKYGWMFSPSKEGAQDSFVEAFAGKYGNAADNGTGGGGTETPSTTSNNASGGGAGGGGGKSSPKGTNAAQAALKEQERAQQQSLQLRRKYEDAIIETYEDEGTRERAKIISQYDREIEDLRIKLEKEKNLTTEDKENINNTIVALEETKQVKLADLFDKQLKKQKEAEGKVKRETEQAERQKAQMRERAIEAEYDMAMAEIDALQTSEKEKTRMRLEAERDRLQKLLALAKAGGKKLTEEEIKAIEAQIKAVNNALKENEKSGDIYDLLGLKLDDKQKAAIDEALSYAVDCVNQFMDAYVAAAEKKRELADREVENAQRVLEKEIEARANGYANEVDTARKELETAKKNQKKAIEEEKKAQQAKEAIDTATQVSSLVTATANIWQAYAGIPFVGTALAIAATALMWGAFAAAKIKANQVAGSGGEEKYGEGTVEMLQGGSHQSGNDIDLGRKKDGTRRRAEGGEFFAVINKRNSRRYRDVIPDVVHSLNDGTFAEKYLNAYQNGGSFIVNEERNTDLSGLSKDVRLIREQGENEQYIDGNGNTVMKYKNLIRIVRR